MDLSPLAHLPQRAIVTADRFRRSRGRMQGTQPP